MPVSDQSVAAQGSGFARPLRVQNLEANTTVFAKQVNGDPLKITFAAHGNAGDTQRVPTALAQDIDFLNSLEQGVLKVVDGPEDLVAELQFETERQRAERAEAAVKVTETLDRRQERDIVGVTCIGPAPAGRQGTCDRPLIQSAKQQAEVPPLCSEHAGLAPTFYLAEAGSKGEDATESRDGVVRREWRQVTMTERQKQVQ